MFSPFPVQTFKQILKLPFYYAPDTTIWCLKVKGKLTTVNISKKLRNAVAVLNACSVKSLD